MDVFDEIYRTNFWRSNESVSGTGSELGKTAVIRTALPVLLNKFSIHSMLDIPCGDYQWMSHVRADVKYIGADIVKALIKHNRDHYPTVDFRVLDITKDRLPKVDMILCRDLLGHFSNADVKKALNNMRMSGATYLLATTFPDAETNGDIITGQWRPINLANMFGLPDPILIIKENEVGKFSNKSLGLWRLDEED